MVSSMPWISDFLVFVIGRILYPQQDLLFQMLVLQDVRLMIATVEKGFKEALLVHVIIVLRV